MTYRFYDHDIMNQISNGRTDLTVEFLKLPDWKSKLNQGDIKLIQWLVYYDDVTALRLVLDHGGDISNINIHDELGNAAFFGHFKTCDFLIEQGADINYKIPDTNETPLHNALCKAGKPYFIYVIRLLLEQGADVNATTVPGKETGGFMRDVRTCGETPLHRAAAFADEDIIQLLLDYGADKKARDANGDSPLTWASMHLRPGSVLEKLAFGEHHIGPNHVRKMKSDHGNGWGNGMDWNFLGDYISLNEKKKQNRCMKKLQIKSKRTKNTSKSWEAIFDRDNKRAEIARLEEEMNAPGFWDNPQLAQEHGKRIKRIKDLIDPLDELQSRVTDVIELAELASMSEESGHGDELQSEVDQITTDMEAFEARCTLSGEHDEGNCFLEIHPGAGGTESCDWALMLYRMYVRFMERQGWKADVVDWLDGDEAGVKSVTVHVKGEMAYGYLRAEIGIHRLVRISPFDSNKRRHTSFAAVHVMPEIDDSIEVDIDENDLRIDTYRSSGKGGQSVNTTDSAVRITHLPTNTVVTCQNERSQRQNKETAMKILAGRLFTLMQEQQAEKISEISGDKRDIAWGNQIRSYVFHPYNMIKDHRTDEERGDIQNVMDGDLERFIWAYLRSTLADQKQRQ